MITRPLFDHVAAKPARRAGSKTPIIPISSKPQPEIWVIRLSGRHAAGDSPVICRVKRLLKSAWRRHRLKAIIVEGPPPIAPPRDSAASISSDGPAGPEIAFNVATRRKNDTRIDP